MILIAFSGRCGSARCIAPAENEDALARDTVPALLAAWSAAGAAPPQLVLLGHSHGTQLAHLLAFEHPEVGFAASILLDSLCWGWDRDHAAGLVARMAPGAGPWAATGPYAPGCDVLTVPGVGRLDLGDVVPWNVTRSLEPYDRTCTAVVRSARRRMTLGLPEAGVIRQLIKLATSSRHRPRDRPGRPAPLRGRRYPDVPCPPRTSLLCMLIRSITSWTSRSSRP